MKRDDCALVAVHGDACVVEGLLRVTQLVAQVRHAALEDASKVARNQGSTNTWNWNIYS
jgi:hypothetical protein